MVICKWLKDKNINVIDATCPFVTKPQEIVKEMSKDFSFENNPPEIASFVYEKMAEIANKKDLYDDIKELFNALFLATPINKSLRDKCVDFGVSHLIALSGFHLGVLSFVLYWVVYLFYKFI